MRWTTAIMLSGGLDSTGLLVDTLVNSSDIVHAHHIRLVNLDRRDEDESKAVGRIVEYCRAHYRPFGYTESAMDYSAFKKVYPDYLIVAFVAAQLARELEGPVRVAVGIMSSDGLHARQCNTHQAQVAKLMYIAHRFIAVNPKVDNFELIHPFANRKSKADLLRELPPELVAMTWSCRRPINGAECGRCRTCADMRRARLEAA